MDPFTLGWILWGVYFCILEGVALVRSAEGDTLSEHIRLWFGTKKGTKPTLWAWARRIFLAVFLLWLTIHFLFGVV